MSPSTPEPATPHAPDEKHPYGLDPDKTTSNERSRPVPWFAGTRRLSVTWLGPAYNQTTEEVTEESDGGKGQDDERTVGHDYFADVAAVVCLGPVDAIHEVWMDDERVWRGGVRRVGNFADITIEERGVMRIYWGTPTQAIEPQLAGFGHPAYRGQCYLYFEQLYFGRDRTQAPNVEVVLGREPRCPVGGVRWIGYDVNPIHCAIEVLTNKRWGLGLSTALLDLAQLATAAQQMVHEGIGISPLVTDQTSARSLLLKICEYIDGAVKFRNGLLQIVLNRVPDPSGLIYPLIGEFDLVEKPEWGSEGWVDTISQIAVNFTDRAKRYERDVEEWGAPSTEAVVGEPVKETLDRDWVCHRGIASAVARRFGRKASTPLLSAKLSVRRNLIDDQLKRRADEVEAGGLIRFTSAAFQQTLLLRVVSVRIPSDRAQVVHMQCETDRYYNAVLDYTPDDVPGPPDDDILPHQLIAASVVELPREMVEDDPGSEELAKPHFCALVARRSDFDTRVKVMASEDGDSYRRFAITKKFALFGTLVAELPMSGRRVDPDGSILLNVPAAVVDRTWPIGSERQWWAGRYVATIGNEFISFREVVVLSAAQVRLKGIIRARFGPCWAKHPAGSQVYLMPRASMRGVARKWLRTDDDVWWKLVPGSKWAFFTIGEVAAQNYTVVNATRRPLGPCNLKVGPNWLPPFTRAVGAGITIQWDSRSWNANGLWASFDAPYAEGSITHRIYFYDAAGDEQGWSNAKDANVVANSDGHFTYTLPFASGSGLSVTSLFGGDPAHFTIRIFARSKGWNSQDFMEARIVTVGSGSTQRVRGALCWPNSGLFHVLRATEPEPLMQANFDAIEAHLQIANPSFAYPFPSNVQGGTIRQARNRSRSNFAAIAAELDIPLHDVMGPGKPNGGWVAEANFEMIDLAWNATRLDPPTIVGASVPGEDQLQVDWTDAVPTPIGVRVEVRATGPGTLLQFADFPPGWLSATFSGPPGIFFRLRNLGDGLASITSAPVDSGPV